MGEHLRRGKLAQPETRGGTLEWKTADGRSSSRTRRQHEQAKIAQHDPPLTRSGGGAGRSAAGTKKYARHARGLLLLPHAVVPHHH